jgi:hypothetical protein
MLVYLILPPGPTEGLLTTARKKKNYRLNIVGTSVPICILDSAQMRFTQDNEMVHTLAPDR